MSFCCKCEITYKFTFTSLHFYLHSDDNLNVVPPHLICSKELTVISENYVINMPDNVNEFKLNDILSNSDPNRSNFNSCNSSRYYTSIELKKQRGHYNNVSIFHTNIRSSIQNLNQLKCYLNSLDVNFSIIGLSKTRGKPQHIDMQTNQVINIITVLELKIR